MISRSGVPIGSSYVPGRTTWPETQKSFGPGLFSGPIERNQSAPRATRELAADVDVGGVAADGVRGDDDALEELVGVVLDDLAVLEGARLALVGVDGEIDGLLALLGQKAPLHAGREAGAAPPAEVRGLHHLDQLLGRAGRERLARRRVAAVLEVHVQLAESRDG